jgi:hypothetical protein
MANRIQEITKLLEDQWLEAHSFEETNPKPDDRDLVKQWQKARNAHNYEMGKRFAEEVLPKVFPNAEAKRKMEDACQVFLGIISQAKTDSVRQHFFDLASIVADWDWCNVNWQNTAQAGFWAWALNTIAIEGTRAAKAALPLLIAAAIKNL